MSVELVHSSLLPSEEQRILRILKDVRALNNLLTRGQIRSVHMELELARDVLSQMLDKADGKFSRY